MRFQEVVTYGFLVSGISAPSSLALVACGRPIGVGGHNSQETSIECTRTAKVTVGASQNFWTAHHAVVDLLLAGGDECFTCDTLRTKVHQLPSSVMEAAATPITVIGDQDDVAKLTEHTKSLRTCATKMGLCFDWFLKVGRQACLSLTNDRSDRTHLSA
jgi:hypothetical protein